MSKPVYHLADEVEEVAPSVAPLHDASEVEEVKPAAAPAPSLYERVKSKLGGAASAVGDFVRATDQAAASQFKAAGRAALNAGTLGFYDNLQGAANAIDPTAGPGTMGEKYERGRDAFRADLASSEREHPIVSPIAGAATSLLLPGAGALAKGVGLGAKAARAALAATEAGAAAVGVSDAATPAEALDAAKTGATLSLGLHGLGAAAGGAVKYLSGGVQDRLEQRLVNEFAEGAKNATRKQRGKLDKVSGELLHEAVAGPDAATLRKAAGEPAAEGIKTLAPVLDRLGQERAELYQQFADKGRGTIDAAGYWMELNQVANAALKAGKTEEAKGLQHLADAFESVSRANDGQVPLPTLRQFTTQTQGAAEAAAGLAGAARIRGSLSRVATGAMDDALTKAAAGDHELAAAAQAVRENNSRTHLLLTIRGVLESRAPAEAGAPSLAARVADKLGTPGVVAGLGAGAASAALDPEHAVRNIAFGLAAGAGAKYAGKAVRAIDRGVTTRAIDVAAGRTSPVAGETAAGLARFVARVVANRAARAKRKQDEE